MERKVNICSLCADSAQSAADLLGQKLGEYGVESVSADFGDAAAFVAGISDLARDGGIIVAAAPVSSDAPREAAPALLSIVSSSALRKSFTALG